MGDFLGKANGSALMSRVKGRDTLPGRRVREAVWAAGFRYRLHLKWECELLLGINALLGHLTQLRATMSRSR